MTSADKEWGSTGRGWGWPGASRKSHYFVEGRSLCMKWMFFGSLTSNQEMGQKPGPDDCVTCWRKQRNHE
jgi:hypothetical protein